MMEKQKANLLVIIPCLNEEENLRELRQEFAKLSNSFDCLVVDDGSIDGTAQVAAEFATVIRLPINVGIGGAVRTAIEYAYRNGYDFCVQVDGDGQHDPQAIENLYKLQQSQNLDIVIGSRFIAEAGFRSTFFRRIGISILSGLLRLLYQIKISDPTSGFRLINRKVMAIFIHEYPTDYPEPISIATALNAKASIGEVSVEMRPRLHGNSSITGFDGIGYMIRVCCAVTLSRLTRVS